MTEPTKPTCRMKHPTGDVMEHHAECDKPPDRSETECDRCSESVATVKAQYICDRCVDDAQKCIDGLKAEVAALRGKPHQYTPHEREPNECRLCAFGPRDNIHTKPTDAWVASRMKDYGCKPPERSGLERLLNRWIDWAVLSVNDAEELRAAVQRALDEREAVTWDRAAVVAKHVGCAPQTALGKTINGCATVLHADFIQYAAEARARRNDGEA